MDRDTAVKELLALAEGRREQAITTLQEATDPTELIEELGQAALLASDGAKFAELAAFIADSNKEGVFDVWNTMDTDPRETVYHYAPAAHVVIHQYADIES